MKDDWGERREIIGFVPRGGVASKNGYKRVDSIYSASIYIWTPYIWFLLGRIAFDYFFLNIHGASLVDAANVLLFVYIDITHDGSYSTRPDVLFI